MKGRNPQHPGPPGQVAGREEQAVNVRFPALQAKGLMMQGSQSAESPADARIGLPALHCRTRGTEGFSRSKSHSGWRIEGAPGKNGEGPRVGGGEKQGLRHRVQGTGQGSRDRGEEEGGTKRKQDHWGHPLLRPVCTTLTSCSVGGQWVVTTRFSPANCSFRLVFSTPHSDPGHPCPPIAHLLHDPHIMDWHLGK